MTFQPPPLLSTPPSERTPRLQGHHAHLPFHYQRLLHVHLQEAKWRLGIESDPVLRSSVGVHHQLHGAPCTKVQPMCSPDQPGIIQSRPTQNREF